MQEYVNKTAAPVEAFFTFKVSEELDPSNTVCSQRRLQEDSVTVVSFEVTRDDQLYYSLVEELHSDLGLVLRELTKGEAQDTQDRAEQDPKEQSTSTKNTNHGWPA